jgi:hypothetical protein
MKGKGYEIDGVKVVVVALPEWSGIPERNLPGGKGIINVWTIPSYNGVGRTFSLYHYIDGDLRGRGISNVRNRNIARKAVVMFQKDHPGLRRSLMQG